MARLSCDGKEKEGVGMKKERQKGKEGMSLRKTMSVGGSGNCGLFLYNVATRPGKAYGAPREGNLRGATVC